MIKKLLSILSVFIISVLMSSVALAAVTVGFVKVNNDEVSPSGTNFLLDVNRGNTLDVRVRLSSDTDLKDVQVEAALRGVDSTKTVDDITDTFDMKTNTSYTKTLTLPLIQKIGQGTYKLRIRISDRDSATIEKTYELAVGTDRHEVEIRDVVLSPDKEIKSGRALLATVRVRNRGQKQENGVKVVVSIPDLGVSATDFIDKLDAEGDTNDQATSQEMFLRIPDDAKTGKYDVLVDTYFNDGDKKTTSKTSIFVSGADEGAAAQPASEDKTDKTIITIASDKQSAAKGSEASYPIALTNAGKTSKTYTITADGAASLSLRVSPNLILLGPGESKAFTIFASSKQETAGEQMFSVTISSNDKVMKQIPLSLNSLESGDSSAAGVSKVKRGLEIGLVVLVVLIVIIGLIIGFSKLRGDGEEEGKEGKEYY